MITSPPRPHGPETPSSAPVPKVVGSNPRRETRGHEEKEKGKSTITSIPLDVQTKYAYRRKGHAMDEMSRLSVHVYTPP